MQAKRAWLQQIIFLLLVVAGFSYLAANAAANLKAQSIASGFDFLDHPAGFGVIFSLIEYSEEASYLRAFWVGVVNTLFVSSLGIVVATALGFFFGVARLASHPLLARCAAVYVEILRNVPLLLQIFFWYFAVLRSLAGPRQSLGLGDLIYLNIRGLYFPVPELGGYGWWAMLFICLWLGVLGYGWLRGKRWFGVSAGGSLLGLLALGVMVPWDVPVLSGFNFQGGGVVIPELLALWLALSTYTSAYIAEIVRAGILAVPRGQSEAGFSLGLSHTQVMSWIVLPQALRLIIPPLTSQYLNLVKNSSLAAAIAFPELVLIFASTVLNHTGQAIEVIAMTMGVYLFLSLSISLAMNSFNSRSMARFQGP